MKLTQDTLNQLLNNFVGSGGAIDVTNGAQVGLASNIADKGPLTDLVDITALTGAAGNLVELEQAPTEWGVLLDGTPVATFPPVMFTADPTDPPQTASWWYVTDGSGGTATTLYAWGRFETSYAMTGTGPSLFFVWRPTIPMSGTWDVSVSYNG